MSDLHKILKEEYEKKVSITPNLLMEMIEEIMDSIPQISSLIEEDDPLSHSPLSYEAIPAPNVSELGWASLRSNDKGAAAQREELEQYLRVIPGADLRGKLKNVQRTLDDPEYAMSLVSFGDDRGARIASTLAYLVFFKTLTTVITNFNAASAGFNFEAFLAVLLGGAQIPAAGATTIADLTDAAGTPISLKLYQEKTLKAGGSYNALIADIAKGAGMMRYVVAAKTLEGADLSREGTVDVYSYDFTVDNIVEILYKSASSENSELIRLPQSIISRKRSLDFKIPKLPTFSDIEERFYDELKSALGDVDWYDNLIADIDYENNRELFKGRKPGYESFTAGSWYTRKGVPSRSAPLFVLLNNFIQEQDLDVDVDELFNIIYRAQEAAREEYWKAIEAANRLGQGLGTYARAGASRDFYNSLHDENQKKRALLLSLGAIRHGNQYELRRRDIYDIERLAAPYTVLAEGQKQPKIGELRIGREQVQELLTRMVNDINREVFEIFEQMAVLQRDLQGYFAGGLEDPKKADSAIRASAEIGGKTEKVKSDVTNK